MKCSYCVYHTTVDNSEVFFCKKRNYSITVKDSIEECKYYIEKDVEPLNIDSKIYTVMGCKNCPLGYTYCLFSSIEQNIKRCRNLLYNYSAKDRRSKYYCLQMLAKRNTKKANNKIYPLIWYFLTTK